jgi:2-hydroxy-3-oxopropionate reductase
VPPSRRGWHAASSLTGSSHEKDHDDGKETAAKDAPMTTTTPLRIAVLGIGMMGLPMARRLCAAGHQVHAWNRTRSKADPLESLGATVHDMPSDAVRDADFVISLLESGPVVDRVLFELGTAQAMRAGALLIDMASIQPREARDHAARLDEMGLAHLDAPVSGGTVGAENGTLVIMAGGRAQDFARAQPIFAIFGRATHVGPHGAGQLAKLANQMIVGITIGAVAEALLFAAKGGADMAKVREAISGGFADSRILQLHGQRMVDRPGNRLRCPHHHAFRSAVQRRRRTRTGSAGPQRPVCRAGQPQCDAIIFRAVLPTSEKLVHNSRLSSNADRFRSLGS